jgi:phospholipase C
MKKLTRRTFLGASATAMGAVALGTHSAQLAQATRKNPADGTLASVKHIVILMQENRSFDHYFGTLRGVRGFDDASALVLRNGDSVFKQRGPQGTVLPFHMDTATTNAMCVGNRANNWKSNHDAWNGGHNDGWVSAKSPLTMGYFTRDDLPFHYALADAFTICDNYYGSIMSATGANRTYLWSGMIDPHGRHEGPIIEGGHESGLTWTTYAERLEDAGVPWKLYHVASDNFGDNGLSYFRQFSEAGPGDVLFDRGMASVAPVTGDKAADIAAALRNDVMNGTLPRVSWIVGPASTCEHPDYSPGAGAHFIHQLFDALTADADVWASTVFLINYDENDDFFDHAVPITPPEGTPDEFVRGLPIGLGPRVPLLVVSPWSRGGYVCSEVFDHTSVIRFLERCTGVVEPNISAWRRMVCGDLTSAFDFTRPTALVPTLPDTATLLVETRTACAALPPPQPPLVPSMPSQEPGTRPQRPLPYQPNAKCNVDPVNGSVLVTMTNAGARAAHCSIYANSPAADGPWQFDIPARDGEVSHQLDARAGSNAEYDYTVYGPNGFLRRFAGKIDDVAGQHEVVATYELNPPGHKKVALAMTNSSHWPAVFTIASIAGRRTFSVAPWQTISDAWDVGWLGNGWYDFTATVDVDAQFLRRIAGHLEDA